MEVNVDAPLRVAIAAPGDDACARIEALIPRDTNLLVVASGASTALPDVLAHVSPDVLVLDLGSEALERIVERVTLPPTVLLTSGLESALHLLDMGVRAVLPERPLAAQLVAAIRAVASGLIVLDQHVSRPEPLGAWHAEGKHQGVEELTPRELRVLQLLAEGLPNKQIATVLDISEHTVKFHLSSIFGKLGAASRTEAIAIGIRRGLVML